MSFFCQIVRTTFLLWRSWLFLAAGVAALVLRPGLAHAAAEEENPLSGSSRLEFDSAVQLGMGSWSAPALPRLVGDERELRFDLAGYDPVASGVHVHLETQLFFPLGLSWLPIGLTVRSLNLITESGALAFTLSADKTQERPRHALALMAGARADFEFSRLAIRTGLEAFFRRIMYLNALSTGVGPLLSVSVDSMNLFPVLWKGGYRPLFSVGAQTCPYLVLSGYDNRGVLDSSGVPREFAESARLAERSTAVYVSVQAEGGAAWVDSFRGREHRVLVGWSGQFTSYSGLVERDQQGRLSPLDLTENVQSFYLSLRSYFL